MKLVFRVEVELPDIRNEEKLQSVIDQIRDETLEAANPELIWWTDDREKEHTIEIKDWTVFTEEV